MLTISNTTEGYLKNVEIKGNTVQNPTNLSDIKSVGKKLENQDLYEIPLLSCGKNLISSDNIVLGAINDDGTDRVGTSTRIEYTKVNSNCSYTLSRNGSPRSANIFYYDSLKKLMSKDSVVKATFTTPSNCKYVRLFFGSSLEDNIQLEEGATATPYEPYKSNKLTILSPCQIEKVGNIADRIIEKNGIWGVEKNIVDIVLDNLSLWKSSSDSALGFKRYYYDKVIDSSSTGIVISDKFKGVENSYTQGDNNTISYNSSSKYIFVSTEKQTLDEFKQIVANLKIKVPMNPQFIPLPHDQQVLLKTFDNKANISFLTEIEGTIKAQVPKSIKATVNTHTSQIENIYDELDRVKKLEESTVSTVTTNKDFANVQATSNGYFEDVKLSGKTLVNLCVKSDKSVNLPVGDYKIISDYDSIRTIPNNTKVTIVPLCNFSSNLNMFRYSYVKPDNTESVICEDKTLKPVLSEIKYGECAKFRVYADVKTQVTNGVVEFLILEGDYTQNPPSYFEGLKSVGDGADEIVVSSVNDGNLFSGTWEDGGITTSTGSVASWANYIRTNDFVEVFSGCRYSCNVELNTSILNSFVYMYDKDKTFIKALSFPKETNFKFDIDNNVKYLKFAVNSTSISISNFIKFSLCLGNEISYTPHKADKKRILYYDTTDSTWKKPVLREWDTIEKHSDGKYYYHQRCEQNLYNGTEPGWYLDSNVESENVILFKINRPTGCKNGWFTVICDKLNSLDIWTLRREGIYCYGGDGGIKIAILKSKLETPDLAGFKKWLQANNVTVVYQLAQEKVFECTNIDLITYANETNYVFAGGVISPRTSLKVHSNISNVVSLLQKKVSVIEERFLNHVITQNRLQLASRYSADSVAFKVDYDSRSANPVDYDLFKLLKTNVLVGKDNYDYDDMMKKMDFYQSIKKIDWDMWDEIYLIIDEQQNPTEELPEEAPVL